MNARESTLARDLRERRDEVLRRAFAAEAAFSYSLSDILFAHADRLDRELLSVLGKEAGECSTAA